MDNLENTPPTAQDGAPGATVDQDATTGQDGATESQALPTGVHDAHRDINRFAVELVDQDGNTSQVYFGTLCDLVMTLGGKLLEPRHNDQVALGDGDTLADAFARLWDGSRGTLPVSRDDLEPGQIGLLFLDEGGALAHQVCDSLDEAINILKVTRRDLIHPPETMENEV